jgi:hypothetical protein
MLPQADRAPPVLGRPRKLDTLGKKPKITLGYRLSFFFLSYSQKSPTHKQRFCFRASVCCAKRRSRQSTQTLHYASTHVPMSCEVDSVGRHAVLMYTYIVMCFVRVENYKWLTLCLIFPLLQTI